MQRSLRDKDLGSGAWGSWKKILLSEDVRVKPWLTENAPDTWLIGENFKGDTSVGLSEVSGHCCRVEKIAMISLSMRFVGFSIVANNDAGISVRLNLSELGKAAGWFKELHNSSLGSAYGMLKGVDWDSPWMPMYCGSGSKASTYPNTLHISTSDTLDIPAQNSNATELHVKAHVTFSVGD